MRERRLFSALELRNDPLGQYLSELYTPLIK